MPESMWQKPATVVNGKRKNIGRHSNHGCFYHRRTRAYWFLGCIFSDEGRARCCEALDISRAREELGFEPKYSVEEGVQKYARWLEKKLK